uniref:Uncharacterized protein n=1 Tax=Amphimedon queenslandica TaxID=400682 RepID=A0A1X7TKI9_AMPQE
IACLPQFISSSNLALTFDAANSTCTAACTTCSDTSNTDTNQYNTDDELLCHPELIGGSGIELKYDNKNQRDDYDETQ